MTSQQADLKIQKEDAEAMKFKEYLYGKIKIYNCDCLELMKTFADKSVDLILTDPPYYKVKGKFDFVFKSFKEYLDFVAKNAAEFQRILKNDGSFLWFGDDRNIAYTQLIFDEYFDFLNHLVWDKIYPLAKGEEYFRKFACRTERILFYEQKKFTQCNNNKKIKDNPAFFRNIKAYMKNELRKFKNYHHYDISTAKRELEKIMETKRMTYHFFGDYQFAVPSQEKYEKLQKTGFFKKDYKDLKNEYKKNRRFFLQIEGQYDVLRYKNNQRIGVKNIHITQKPLPLIERLVRNTSQENALVFDGFLGSGTTAIACVKNNRRFIGCEIDAEYFELACGRIENELKQLDLFNAERTDLNIAKVIAEDEIKAEK